MKKVKILFIVLFVGASGWCWWRSHLKVIEYHSAGYGKNIEYIEFRRGGLSRRILFLGPAETNIAHAMIETLIESNRFVAYSGDIESNKFHQLWCELHTLTDLCKTNNFQENESYFVLKLGSDEVRLGSDEVWYGKLQGEDRGCRVATLVESVVPGITNDYRSYVLSNEVAPN